MLVKRFLSDHLAAMDDSSNKSMDDLWWELYFGNIEALRAKIEPVIGRIPFAWVFLMKHFIPHVLIILFVNLAQSETGYATDDDGEEIPGTNNPQFGHYGHYATRPYQILGIMTFVFASFLFLAGLVLPQLYEPLAMPQTLEAMAELEQYMTKEEYEKLSVKYNFAPGKGESQEKEETETEKVDEVVRGEVMDASVR